jgi:predicted DNA-binding ribbon-helix-helix protein
MSAEPTRRVGFSATVPPETFRRLEALARARKCHWTQMIEKLINEASSDGKATSGNA